MDRRRNPTAQNLCRPSPVFREVQVSEEGLVLGRFKGARLCLIRRG